MSDTSTETRTPTYAFARHQGLVVIGEVDGPSGLGVRAGADPMAIVEARRALGRTLRFTPLDASRFERELSEAYARSAIENEEADAAMDSHGDLHALIDDIPQTADLLDGDDDAPVKPAGFLRRHGQLVHSWRPIKRWPNSTATA